MTRPGLDPDGLRRRGLVLRALRDWMHAHGFVDVPTPCLVPTAAVEATLEPVRAGDGLLRTSPELALKRVVAAGLPRVYELGPCFRDEEHGPWHRREFLLLEWYRVGGRLSDLMEDVASLVHAAAEALGVEVPAAFETHTVRALVHRHTDLDLATATTAELSSRDSDWDTAFFRRWLEEVEPRLPSACFVTDWPASQAALAVVRDAPWPVARRVEAYLQGVELANGFEELTDATEQGRRFAASARARAAEGRAPHPVDEAFLEAVGRLPPTAGIALGVDRLVAVLCGWSGIARGRVERPSSD